MTEEKKLTFLESIYADDVIGAWVANGLLGKYYQVDANTGLIIRSPGFQAFWDLPWIMVNNDGTRECDFYKQVEAIYGFIPPPCMECWKVVVFPKTLKQLMQVLQIEMRMTDANPYCFCKCGIEMRPDVERNYGGYFYTSGINEGLIRLTQVREELKKVFGENSEVKAILKRACTEYERAHGPSDKWDELVTDKHRGIWKKLNEVFALTKKHTRQPEIIKKHVLTLWLNHAISIGDPSIKEFNDGKNFYPGYVLYDIEEAKK